MRVEVRGQFCGAGFLFHCRGGSRNKAQISRFTSSQLTSPGLFILFYFYLYLMLFKNCSFLFRFHLLLPPSSLLSLPFSYFLLFKLSFSLSCPLPLFHSSLLSYTHFLVYHNHFTFTGTLYNFYPFYFLGLLVAWQIALIDF